MIEFLDNIQLGDKRIIDKKWGKEVWNHNSDRLCLKLLIIDKDKQCSMHFHKNKREIFIVQKGKIFLEYIDTKNGFMYNEILNQGRIILVPEMTPHRFTGMDDENRMLEASTFHEDSDSYRVMPGDSQK